MRRIKTNIDDKTKMADIKLKAAQLKEINEKLLIEKQRIELEKERNEIDKKKTTIDRINQVGRLLESVTVDESNTIKDFALKQVFDEEETRHLKKKLMQILREL